MPGRPNEWADSLRVIICDFFVNIIIIVAAAIVLATETGYSTTAGKSQHPSFFNPDKSLAEVFISL